MGTFKIITITYISVRIKLGVRITTYTNFNL